ncbi:hypothetical protein [Streptomyces sp. NBC_01314]|uniref:hypothetical protein n=1 Tax=Streptomyces sp. NBC_01314 TaxID=2903821 RepID=UPI00352E2885
MRCYEEQRLLGATRTGGGQRQYPEGAVARVRMIQPTRTTATPYRRHYRRYRLRRPPPSPRRRGRRRRHGYALDARTAGHRVQSRPAPGPEPGAGRVRRGSSAGDRRGARGCRHGPRRHHPLQRPDRGPVRRTPRHPGGPDRAHHRCRGGGRRLCGAAGEAPGTMVIASDLCDAHDAVRPGGGGRPGVARGRDLPAAGGRTGLRAHDQGWAQETCRPHHGRA